VGSDRLDNRAENLIVVDARPLGEALYCSRVLSELNLCLKIHLLWAPHGARRKSTKHAMNKPRRVERSDCLGWWSDRQPLFGGRSDRLRPRSDRQQRWGPVAVDAQSDRLDRWSHCQPLSGTRSDRLGQLSNHQRRGGTRTLGGGGRGAGSGVGMEYV
jgi:hypothetical protein